MDAELLWGLVKKWRDDANEVIAPRDELDKVMLLAMDNTLHDCANELEVALSVAQGQGFVMVPRVPTEAMIDCAIRFLPNVPRVCMAVAIEDAIECAAAAPAQPGGVGK